jgi:hypothetical protein
VKNAQVDCASAVPRRLLLCAGDLGDMLQGTRRLRGNERILTEPHAAFWNPAVYDNWVVPVNAIGNLLREDGCHAPLRSAEALLALDELAILRVVGGILAPQRRNDTKRRLQSQMFYLF